MTRKPAITFPYKKGVDGSFRPVISVELHKKNSSGKITVRRVEVLVDSGADECVFWGEIGEALGIKVKSGKPHPFYGVGGLKSMGYEHKIGIKAGTETINAMAVFSYDISQGLALVGQKDFFEHFVVKFDYKDLSITLRKN